MTEQQIVNVQKIFQGIAEKMLVDFNEIHSQIVHKGERGGQREEVLRGFLEKYLPQKYSIGTGHIIDQYGKISRQCDVVIYDAFNCPLLLVEKGYQLFPVESVYGVVEVKSSLDANSIKESAKNIQSVKQLRHVGSTRGPVAGGVFAYTTAYITEPKIELVANTLRQVNNSIPYDKRVDLLCILTDGILMDHKGKHDSDSVLNIYTELAPTNLFMFLHHLIELIGMQQTSMPSLIGYTLSGKVGEVGLVKQVPSSERDS